MFVGKAVVRTRIEAALVSRADVGGAPSATESAIPVPTVVHAPRPAHEHDVGAELLAKALLFQRRHERAVTVLQFSSGDDLLHNGPELFLFRELEFAHRFPRVRDGFRHCHLHKRRCGLRLERDLLRAFLWLIDGLAAFEPLANRLQSFHLALMNDALQLVKVHPAVLVARDLPQQPPHVVLRVTLHHGHRHQRIDDHLAIAPGLAVHLEEGLSAFDLNHLIDFAVGVHMASTSAASKVSVFIRRTIPREDLKAASRIRILGLGREQEAQHGGVGDRMVHALQVPSLRRVESMRSHSGIRQQRRHRRGRLQRAGSHASSPMGQTTSSASRSYGRPPRRSNRSGGHGATPRLAPSAANRPKLQESEATWVWGR
mmetsp:Transcript_15783/g.43134  ORF Transcript_15783/g.43134 Transcript_15783/m.43134 type:complete len:372 (+) Transcript_15783:219-1334(+)